MLNYKFGLILLLSGLCTWSAIGQTTPYERLGGNKTTTYAECIDYYRELDEQYACVHVEEMGSTDAGEPLHIVLMSSDKKFDPLRWHQQNKVVILINNGIHPGEPDGIDASMMWVRDLARKWDLDSAGSLPDNVCLAIVPVYNIGGCLNRSAFHRVDQNGPDEFGTRGNSQNLDLNRDFIKCDSKEARSFSELFQWINPDIFMDNHVSDGADYPNVMTLATSQYNKLGGEMGQYLNTIFEPALFEAMAAKNYPMLPYVNTWNKDARLGWPQFFDAPRYSTGYATLFNTFGFTPESHMLKPYPQRVAATYQLMQCMVDFASTHAKTIKNIRAEQIQTMLNQTNFPLRWTLDKSKAKLIDFTGYEYKTRLSKVSDLPVSYYDQTSIYTEKIKFQNTYIPALEIHAPSAYLIPQGWWKVIELLKLNGVEMIQLDMDTILDAEAYTILDYKSLPTPFEGHHANSEVSVKTQKMKVNARKNDYWISTNQLRKRFIIEVLEPQSNDGYFAWNFFDAILAQKEGYSAYAYEAYAAEYLETDPNLKNKLLEKRKSDEKFAQSAAEQLDFVFRNSPYYEERHNLYPVFRIVSSKESPSIQTNKSNETKLNKSDE